MMQSFLLSFVTATILLGYEPRELQCLSEAIYFEARGEPLIGQLAVGNVIMNRVSSPRFPNTICKVVHQGRKINGQMVRNKCQFSYYCDGKTEEMTDAEALIISSTVAMNVLLEPPMFMETATHYHAIFVEPDWSLEFEWLGRIGNHDFYQ